MTLRRLSAGPVALLVAAGLLLAGCAGGDDRPTLERRQPGTTLGTGTTAPPVLAPGTSQVANVSVKNIDVFDAPDAPEPKQSFESPWHINNDPKLAVPLVFLVEQQQGDWVQVLLPIRPNGSTGWVRAKDVVLSPVPYRIKVELAAHQITVYNGDAVLLQEPVANGAAATPTPVGKYYLRVLLRAPDPNTVYGPYAYGLSGHSDALQTFNGGDAEVGIHGNNDASVLGTSITHGCIRMSNSGVTKLATILPLGTPVEIVA